MFLGTKLIFGLVLFSPVALARVVDKTVDLSYNDGSKHASSLKELEAVPLDEDDCPEDLRSEDILLSVQSTFNVSLNPHNGTNSLHIVVHTSGRTPVTLSYVVPPIRNCPPDLPRQLSARLSTRSKVAGNYCFGASQAVRNRMTDMEAIPGDAKGHLIAQSLGGTNDLWNLAPQSTGLNNGDGFGVGWKSMELEIRNWIYGPVAGNEVEWLTYLDYLDAARPCRPSHFMVQAVFWNANGPQRARNIYCDNDLRDPLNPLCQEFKKDKSEIIV